MGQRITGMTSGQNSLPVAGTIFKFEQHGQSGKWLSELIPRTGKIADQIALIRTMNTDAINHDPAMTFIQSGSQQPGRPSLGAWVSYGLGSENENLPAFVVLISQANALNNDQPLFSRLWGSGFLPSSHQGVRFRAGGDPVLYLADPAGVDRETRRKMLDAVAKLNHMNEDAYGDPEIATPVDGSFEGTREHVRDVRTRFAKAGHICRELSTGSPAGGVRRAIHRALPSRVGSASGPASRSGITMQRHRPAILRAGSGFEAARPAGRHFSGLGGEFGRTVYCQGKLTETN
jgi:hypothetical protein